MRLECVDADGTDEVEGIATLELTDAAPTGERIQVLVRLVLVDDRAGD